MHFQWYPGHMKKAIRSMQEDIKLIDVIIELVDARIPISSKNPDIDELAKNKSRILILNKSDMADKKCLDKWCNFYKSKGYITCILNSKEKKQIKKVNELITIACKEKIERNIKKGIKNRPIRAMIVGIPNVGKSTFINSFSGRASAKTGNKPGVTKGKQWIYINKQVELLDTPGILWPKFEDQIVGKHLAFIGAIKDERIQNVELAMDLIDFMQDKYPTAIENFYKISIESNDSKSILEQVAKVRACIKKGNELDYEKAAFMIMDDFRNARIGCFNIEFCQ